jgi:hypothetical protein
VGCQAQHLHSRTSSATAQEQQQAAAATTASKQQQQQSNNNNNNNNINKFNGRYTWYWLARVRGFEIKREQAALYCLSEEQTAL